jgi:hypothetical protein
MSAPLRPTADAPLETHPVMFDEKRFGALCDERRRVLSLLRDWDNDGSSSVATRWITSPAYSPTSPAYSPTSPQYESTSPTRGSFDPDIGMGLHLRDTYRETNATDEERADAHFHSLGAPPEAREVDDAIVQRRLRFSAMAGRVHECEEWVERVSNQNNDLKDEVEELKEENRRLAAELDDRRWALVYCREERDNLVAERRRSKRARRE